jgi:hypothetical protein
MRTAKKGAGFLLALALCDQPTSHRSSHLFYYHNVNQKSIKSTQIDGHSLAFICDDDA